MLDLQETTTENENWKLSSQNWGPYRSEAMSPGMYHYQECSPLQIYSSGFSPPPSRVRFPTDCWLGNLTDYIITSLSHQQKDTFMCNTIYITYLKSWFSIAQCPVCKLRCPCIQNVPVNYLYNVCIYRGIFSGNHRSRVWKSQKCEKKCIFRTFEQAGTNMLNGIPNHKF